MVGYSELIKSIPGINDIKSRFFAGDGTQINLPEDFRDEIEALEHKDGMAIEVRTNYGDRTYILEVDTENVNLIDTVGIKNYESLPEYVSDELGEPLPPDNQSWNIEARQYSYDRSDDINYGRVLEVNDTWVIDLFKPGAITMHDRATKVEDIDEYKSLEDYVDKELDGRRPGESVDLPGGTKFV